MEQITKILSKIYKKNTEPVKSRTKIRRIQ